jgi:hypothetical protein
VTKKELSDKVNAILGLSGADLIDFSRLRISDLELLLSVLEKKPSHRLLDRERPRLLQNRPRPLRNLLGKIAGTP